MLFRPSISDELDEGELDILLEEAITEVTMSLHTGVAQ